MPINIHYTLHGPTDGPRILFLHGFLGRGDDWNEVVAALEPRFRCLTLDLPGHGGTVVEGGLEEYGMESSARAVADLLERLNYAPCLLVGYSMGGRLALYLAAEYPDLFHRVLVESATPGLESEEERASRRAHDEALAQALENGTLEEFLQRWFDQPLFESLHNDPARFEELLRRRLENNPEELAKSLRAMGTGVQPPLWDRLPHIRVPIIAIAGRFDAKYCAIAQRMQMRCPACRVHILSGCGHNVHFENPAGYTRALRALLLEEEE